MTGKVPSLKGDGMKTQTMKQLIGIAGLGLFLNVGNAIQAAPQDTRIIDHDLIQTPNALIVKVDRLQNRVDHMKARCERFEFAFCKEVTDVSTDLKEIRGETDERSHLDSSRINDLEQRMAAVDNRLNDLEGVLAE